MDTVLNKKVQKDKEDNVTVYLENIVQIDKEVEIIFKIQTKIRL